MIVDVLITDLRARGVVIVADGDRLRCRPRSALTHADLVALLAYKLDLLQRLKGEQTPVDPSLVCWSCREHRFWQSIHGAVVCGTCHPPAHRDLVARWVGNAAREGCHG